MRVVHRVYVERGDVDVAELQSIGVDVAELSRHLIRFEVGEDESHWPAVQQWMQRTRSRDWIHAEFSDEEIASAAWCVLSASYNRTNSGGTEIGPRDGARNVHLRATFDLSEFCATCGIGRRQVSPFRLAGAPIWDGDDILELDWFAGEAFVKPAVYAACFAPFGVASSAVEDTTGRELEGIVQLVVEDFIDVLADDRTAQRCPTCTRIRYAPYVAGHFPPLATDPTTACVRPTQWFGADSVAHRRILVSQRIVAAFKAHGVRGVGLHPVAEGTRAGN